MIAWVDVLRRLGKINHNYVLGMRLFSVLERTLVLLGAPKAHRVKSAYDFLTLAQLLLQVVIKIVGPFAVRHGRFGKR